MAIGPLGGQLEGCATALRAYVSALREIQKHKAAHGDYPVVRSDEERIMAMNALEDVGLKPTDENIELLKELYAMVL